MAAGVDTALSKLILDGRIHPARIEKVVAKAQDEVDQIVREAHQGDPLSRQRLVEPAYRLLVEPVEPVVTRAEPDAAGPEWDRLLG